MMGRRTIDIEGALYEALAVDGWHASAPPVPAGLGGRLPHVHVIRTGGYESSCVQDMHQVDFDVYAADEQAAMEAACSLTSWVRSLAGGGICGVPVYVATVTTLPYGNPDPMHQSLSRATFKAQILTRTA